MRCLALLWLATASVSGQSVDAAITGIVTDPSRAVVVAAKVVAINRDTDVRYQGLTDTAGNYAIPNLPPGTYRLEVEKPGFETLLKSDIVLHVQDVVAINFEMPVGSASESVTVEGGAPQVNTTDASVSSVVSRQFVDNIPLNGRSFQSLIELTPGVVATPASSRDSGQFSVNGQRAASNYWMVDGVGANIGVSTYFIAGDSGGAVGGVSISGGTSSLVSVDALEEFRIQTSTYLPEFGRMPGAQISILTRSGTNRFHGTLYDYLRNDKFDANDWFANRSALPKPKERQNDFGGVLGGPIRKDKTFFFFSYEGLRLRLPEVAITTVPTVAARAAAVPAIQPFLNAYPLPNGPSTGVGQAQFNASFSNSSQLDATSLRIDHRWSDKLTLFGRYNYAPSGLVQRANQSSISVNTLYPADINTQTATAGATWMVSPTITEEIRFNYSRNIGKGTHTVDSFGGATPVPTALLNSLIPSPYSLDNSYFYFGISNLSGGGLQFGTPGFNRMEQENVIDNLSWQKKGHSLKFGVDYRRLTPDVAPYAYLQQNQFASVATAETGNLLAVFLRSNVPAPALFQNLGVFAQDTWRMTHRLTLSCGIRWDVDFAPTPEGGPGFFAAVSGFGNPASLALAPQGTPIFNTKYGNFAPRAGIAYQLVQKRDWETVLRGGFGVFYDVATQEVNGAISGNYPYGSSATIVGGTFPASATTVAPPVISPAQLTSGTLSAFDPGLTLPYTLQWNVSFAQGMGSGRSLTASYVGAAGRRLIETETIQKPNPGIGLATLVTNAGVSDYDALQLQFQQEVSKRLQVLASYTWSHSIDTSSASSNGATSNEVIGTAPDSNRGPSDFDIRQSLSAAATYDIQAPSRGALWNAMFRGWSLNSMLQARTAPPVNLNTTAFSYLTAYQTAIRPDVVPGMPLYLYGPQYAGGKAFNPAAFTNPPASAGVLLRNGDLGRNALRGFGASQWDFSVHREIPIHEQVKLQFRAEMFNILNHPNFASPIGITTNSLFGQSTQMLGRSLDGIPAGGSFSSLYQFGGPRSIQFSLKLLF